MNVLNLNTILNKDLLLVHTPSNCYAIVKDNVSKEILWTEKSKNIEELKATNLSFENVATFIVNKQFTLLPTALLTEDKANEYLSFTTNISEKDSIFIEKENLNKTAIIWALKHEDKQTIIEKYRQTSFHNLITSLLSISNGIQQQNKIVTFFVDDLLIILTFKNNVFQFVNIFDINSIEDALYYHLLTLQSLELDQKEVTVYTGGFYIEMQSFLDKMENYFSNIKQYSLQTEGKIEQQYLDLTTIID